MATYLASFFVSSAGAPVRVLWWVHTLALLTFLPIVPYTKHLHLLLSPVTVFLSRGSFSQIPPLSGDEDFGLVAGTDLTQLVSLQAYSCVECGRCTEHCPAANTGKLLNPKEIVLGLRDYLNDLGPQSDQPLLGKYNSQEAAFQCTTCGACEFQCPVGIEHVPILVGLRRGAVNTGEWQDDHGSKLFLALERGSNSLGISPTERDKFIEKQELKLFDGTQEYCLWLGCMGGYDPKGREIVADFARVMNYLGTSYGVLRKEKSRKSSPSVRTASAPSRKTGRNMARHPRSSTTANFSPALPTSCTRPKTRKKLSSTIPATWAVTATSTKNRAPSLLSPANWWKPRAITSAAFVAEPAAGSLSWEKNRANASATCALRNSLPLARRPSLPLALSATQCSATRSRPREIPRRNSSTLPRLPLAVCLLPAQTPKTFRADSEVV